MRPGSDNGGYGAHGNVEGSGNPGSLNLSQFVAALQGAEEKRARGKGTEYNSHETAAEASMPLGPLASAGGGIRTG